MDGGNTSSSPRADVICKRRCGTPIPRPSNGMSAPSCPTRMRPSSAICWGGWPDRQRSRLPFPRPRDYGRDLFLPEPCMARDQIDMTPIELARRTRRVARGGLQAAGGVPHRHRAREIRLHASTATRRSPMTGRAASARCSKACSTCSAGSRSWRATTSSASLDVTGGGAISLEPGGQFELSGAPLETVHQTCTELIAHLAQVREVARAARHRLPRPRHDAELDAAPTRR